MERSKAHIWLTVVQNVFVWSSQHLREGRMERESSKAHLGLTVVKNVFV